MHCNEFVHLGWTQRWTSDATTDGCWTKWYVYIWVLRRSVIWSFRIAHAIIWYSITTKFNWTRRSWWTSTLTQCIQTTWYATSDVTIDESEWTTNVYEQFSRSNSCSLDHFFFNYIVFLGWWLFFLFTCPLRCMYLNILVTSSHLHCWNSRLPVPLATPQQLPWCLVHRIPTVEKCLPTVWEIFRAECHQDPIRW